MPLPDFTETPMYAFLKNVNEVMPHNVIPKLLEGQGTFSATMPTADIVSKNIFGAGGQADIRWPWQGGQADIRWPWQGEGAGCAYQGSGVMPPDVRENIEKEYWKKHPSKVPQDVARSAWYGGGPDTFGKSYSAGKGSNRTQFF